MAKAKIRVEAPAVRNIASVAMIDPFFRRRAQKNKLGKGSYTRKPKHSGRD